MTAISRAFQDTAQLECQKKKKLHKTILEYPPQGSSNFAIPDKNGKCRPSPFLSYICQASGLLWQVNKSNRSLDQLTFRIALARQLIDGYSSRKKKGRPTSFQAKQCVVPDDVRLATVGNYVPKMLSSNR
ncbi:piggyBac transposable element-derived protein 4 [Trichonephila clavipes]|nr:piggyBac transposable element-derived protein 4 [Trichonephila clavipes]